MRLKKCWRWVLSMIVAAPLGLASAQTTRIGDLVEEVILDNGMRLLLAHRPDLPSVAAGWVAHVGSANEQPGLTGISHLFEHMMFKGSNRIGTRDAARDAAIRSQLDAVRQQMFEREKALRQDVRLGKAMDMIEARRTDPIMRELQGRFDELLASQREVLVKDEFDQIYTEAGATGMNAFTNEDMTVYFVQVPTNKLELWFWMESERLADPVFREFYSERDVVFEERRMRTESSPTGAADEMFNALFWQGHPYAWPVVGWPSDIAAITRSQADSYFARYYDPGNITAALVGSFDRDQVVSWANAYFGRIPGSHQEPPDVVTLSMPLSGRISFEDELDSPPRVSLYWRTQSFGGQSGPALEVLASVLAGKTGRLHQQLVIKDQIAVNASASASAMKYDGSFMVGAMGHQATTLDELEAALWIEIRRIRDEGISDYELEKVRNKLAAAKFRRLEDPFYLMVQLLYYEGLGDWRQMDRYFERLGAVTAAEVQEAARNFLVDDGYAVKRYQRRSSP